MEGEKKLKVFNIHFNKQSRNRRYIEVNAIKMFVFFNLNEDILFSEAESSGTVENARAKRYRQPVFRRRQHKSLKAAFHSFGF